MSQNSGTMCGSLQVRGVREWLSAFPFLPIHISFNSILILIPIPAKRLFPFPLFSHIDIPIPSHSRSRLPNINDCVQQLMEIVRPYNTIIHKSQHCGFSNINSRHNFDTVHYCVKEDRNKSYYGPLCESRKQRSQSVGLP